MTTTKEFLTAELLRNIVSVEADRLAQLQMRGILEPNDIAKLEKLAKTFSILAAEQRESLKGGLGHLDNEALLQLQESLDGTTDTTDNSHEP